ncbi:site-specific integrase [Ligilactobacillus animalis]|uniref:site-specific integrase n=1 Tax=Ligilactobacillus animalis TaxID=1605 RepID=UPI0026DFBA3D|nr:site-specific integrase [Ligilactobacillus animalis]MDO5882579.1 tyrosine-type recombinase/integrase [Ligilactobacillus animalis]
MASYRKLKTGWKVTISKRDSNGKLKQVSKNGFATKNEAKMYAAKIEAQQFGVIQQKKSVPFADYFYDWFLLYKKSKLAKISQQRYLIIHRAIQIFFGAVHIKNITRQEYQKFINWYGSNHAKDTVLKTHRIIRSCVKSAIFDDIISKDFTYNVEIIFDKSRDITVEYLSVSEIQLLSKTLKQKLNPRYPSRYMILFAIYTGARLGEIQALTWSDIDFDHNTVSINKSWNYHDGGGFKETKTESSNRVIRLNGGLLSLLAQLKPNDPKMVFTSSFGSIPTSNAVNKTLRSVMQECSIVKNNFHFHSLRHSHVAYLLYQGIDLYAISKRLGHSDMTTTAKKYAYLIDEHKAQSDDLIEAAINDI